LSVLCLTYNHETFIEKAILGFLKQLTDFRVEIIIHDDASTDGTRGILLTYAERHPELIKVISPEVNLYKTGRDLLSLLAPLARGRYIAFCDGDDYWADSHKLQKQVNFLESNSSYSISGNDNRIVSPSGVEIASNKLPANLRMEQSAENLKNGDAWLPFSSVVLRNVILKEPIFEISGVVNKDIFIYSLIGAHGHSWFHTDIESGVCHRHPNSSWGPLDEKQKNIEMTNTYFQLYRYWLRVGDSSTAMAWWKKWKIMSSRV